jgi:hypothetical protein
METWMKIDNFENEEKFYAREFKNPLSRYSEWSRQPLKKAKKATKRTGTANSLAGYQRGFRWLHASGTTIGSYINVKLSRLRESKKKGDARSEPIAAQPTRRNSVRRKEAMDG